MKYVVSTDSGGTFVDGVILDEQGRSFIGKAPTTPGEMRGRALALKMEADRLDEDVAIAREEAALETARQEALSRFNAERAMLAARRAALAAA